MLTMNLIVILVALVAVIQAEEQIGIPLAARTAEEVAHINDGRITGGRPAALGSHPYFGGLLVDKTDGTTGVCGCSLMSNTRCVTAAHCWQSTKGQGRSLTAVFGSINLNEGGTRRVTNNVQVHPNYNQNNLANDIAMVKFDPITFSNLIQPINLPVGQTNNLFVGVTASAVGFGRTVEGQPLSPTLNEVELQVITNEMCAPQFNPNDVTAGSLCTDGSKIKNICGGDSGGPLTFGTGSQRVLIGVTSFHHAKGCQSGLPGVFTRVTSFISWIQTNL